MSIYMIIESQVRDAAIYGQYVQLVAPIIERYGGRYLVHGGKVTPLGSEWHPERVIILEFPAESYRGARRERGGFSISQRSRRPQR